MKKFVIIVLIAAIHFGVSVMIIPMTMSVATAGSTEQLESPLAVRTLVAVTRILHFPIISLSWYSRQWFPGDLIYITISINSFLWAAVIYFFVLAGKKMKAKNKNGKRKY